MEKWMHLAAQSPFPPEAVSGMPRLVWYGREKLFLEQHRGLMTCREELFEFQTACGRVLIEGRGMELARYTKDSALIRGEIEKICYLKELK